MGRFVALSDGASFLNKDTIVRVELGLQNIQGKDVHEVIIYANDSVFKSRQNRDNVMQYFTAIFKFDTEKEALDFINNELDV